MLGAAGGVGLAAVQIGKVVGAIVIAVARYLHIFISLMLLFLWELRLQRFEYETFRTGLVLLGAEFAGELRRCST